MATRSRACSTVMALTMVVVLLLAACSTTPSSQGPSETSTKDTKPYGSLTIAVNFRTGTMDPSMTSPAAHQVLTAAIFDSMGELTAEGKGKPGLAERWEIAPDGMTQTFSIRKGVKFHDGSDLTAADVKFSFEKAMAPDALHSDAPSWRAIVAGVDQKDDYTVVLRLKQPLFDLLPGFEDMSGITAIMPKKYLEEKGIDYFRQHPVGSGPFKVVKWEPNVRLELEAVESHWRKVPQYKNITLLHSVNEATNVAMLRTGELDLAEVSSDSVAGLKSAGLRILGHDGGAQAIGIIAWDRDHPENYAFGDVRVRKGLSLAINRQELSDKLYSGYAEPSPMVYVRSTAYFWDPNQLKADPYDAEGAKKLLADAGFANGFKATVWDGGMGVYSTNLSQAIAGYWNKIGVKADVISIDYNGSLRAKYTPKQLPDVWNTLFIPTTGGGFWNFEKVAMTYHSQKATGTFKSVNNAKLDALIDKVPLTKDQAEKKKLALEAAVMAKSEYSTLPLLEVRSAFALGSKVGEITPTKGMAGLATALETITHAK